jgi:hypothetical protein
VRLLFVFAIAPVLLVGVGTASGHQGHTSCKDSGQLTALEAQAGTLVDEIHSFGPGNVDDVIAAFHSGGTVNGQPVEALCDPK